MDLANELRKAKIKWSIDQVIREKPSRHEPGVVRRSLAARVRLTDLEAPWPSGADEPPIMEAFYSTGGDDASMQKLLSLAIRDLMPQHPLRRAYLDSVGNTPVTIKSEHLNDNLGEIIHVQMRKCLQGPASVIQWNGVHHLLPADWSQMLELIREEVRLAQEEANPAQGLLRRNVGMAIKKAMTERMDDVIYRLTPKGDRVKRTDIQEYALKSIHAANSLTEDPDWVFGWTAYLCDDAPAPEKKSEEDATPEPSSISPIRP